MHTPHPRGFAAMDSDLQKIIARKGGVAAHKKGRAHQFNSGEARLAGRKGGLSVSRDRAHMALIGRHGGRTRGARALAARQNGDGHRGHLGAGLDLSHVTL